MKVALSIATLALLFVSCQKDLSSKHASLPSNTLASDALTPLPCHSTSFVTDYPIQPGEQPPFRFAKTQYSDTRVKTINMLTRAVPSYPTYKKLMWETIGTFSYTTNQATLMGTKELWEYYKTPAGAAARRSLQKKTISLTFNFNQKGYVQTVINNYGQWDQYSQVYRPSVALNIVYAGDDPSSQDPADALSRIYIHDASDEGIPGKVKSYVPVNDKYGNPLNISTYEQPFTSGVSYTYDYNMARNGKSYSFIPSQNLISLEYNLSEVMQWLPQPTHQRKTVMGKFYLDNPNHDLIFQSQSYYNYRFDSRGNEISVSYGDNVPQRTTWSCN